MINETINSKILAVWHKYFDDVVDANAPMFYDEFEHGGLVFVGMNPSVNSRVFKAAVHESPYKDLNPETFIRWENMKSNPQNIDINIEIGRRVKEVYSKYFGPMHKMAKECVTHFQHIDLFVYRQTKQKDFLKLVRNKDKQINDFGRAQFDIFLEVLNEIHPKVIIVSNAGASRIVRAHFQDKLEFDEEVGYHWLTLKDKRTPIFFSAMLSGQGQLDIGSFERLKWHVRRAYIKQSFLNH